MFLDAKNRNPFIMARLLFMGWANNKRFRVDNKYGNNGLIHILPIDEIQYLLILRDYYSGLMLYYYGTLIHCLNGILL
jgi:hypothetical protein